MIQVNNINESRTAAGFFRRLAGACFRLLFGVAVFAVLCSGAAASGGDYLQTVWTTENGLPQNSVNAIIQSRSGYLWLATFGGLARFDGVRFVTFNSGNTPGLKNNRILSLCEDRSGAIWLAAQDGAVMRFKDGAGRTFTTADGLPGGVVLGIKEAADGSIWVGTLKGMARLPAGADKFVVYTTGDGLPDDHVWEFADDANGDLWVVTGKGLARFDGDRFEPIDSPADFSKNTSFALVAGRSGNLWTLTENGVMRYANGRFVVYPNRLSAARQNIKTLYEDRSGALWLGGDSLDDVYKLKDGVFTKPRIENGGETLRTIYEDREGNYWIGTDGGGLMRLKRRDLNTLSTADGLPDDNLRAVTEDGAGGMWITTALGLTHWRASGKTFYRYPNSALCRSRNGALWIGSNLGLSEFKNGVFTEYKSELGVPNPGVYALYEDSDETLWVGTASGLSRRQNGEFTALTEADGLVNNDVRYIAQTGDGALWFGTTGGASRLGRDGRFTNYTTGEGLSNNYVRDIYEEIDGAIWFGTYGGGLNRLRDGKIVAVTTKNGLFDDFVSRILPDERGNFWLLSNRGIFKINRRELNDFADGAIESVTTVAYGTPDGMISSEGNGGVQPAGWLAANGKMWFPTIKGLVVVDSGAADSPPPPPAVIEIVSIEKNRAPLGDRIAVNPGEENIEIEYAGLSLSRPEQVKFKYRMTGLDADWVNAGTRRTAYYSHLPPGEYQFEVLADNGENVWSESPAAVRFVVRPPFYRTVWFVVLMIFAAAATGFAFYRQRVSALERRRRVQEEFSRRLISAHETERRRIAAELHDSLGQHLAMIKNSAVFGAQTANDLSEAKEHLQEISTQSAQAISEVREISFNLRPYLIERVGLTKAIESLLEKVEETGALRVVSEIEDIDGLFADEAEVSIYRIIQESLNNVLKHAGARQVGVSVTRDGRGAVTIKIQDDGSGFDAQSRSETGGLGGFGLLGMSERVRMLGGTIAFRSEPSRGTTVKVELWQHK